MRNCIGLIFILLFALACQTKKDDQHASHTEASSSAAPADTIKKSIPKETHATIGSAHFSLVYHAPAVRGRTIWGGLVPYNEVWVTGAHRATSLEVNQDFSLNGNKIPAGKYAIFTIPGTESWTVIINKKWDQHLADEYDSKDDVVRFMVVPENLATVQERLDYSIETESDTKGTLIISWEKLKLRIPIEF